MQKPSPTPRLTRRRVRQARRRTRRVTLLRFGEIRVGRGAAFGWWRLAARRAIGHLRARRGIRSLGEQQLHNLDVVPFSRPHERRRFAVRLFRVDVGLRTQQQLNAFGIA